MKRFLILGSALLLPAVAGAQELRNLERLAESLQDLINILIPVAIGIAVLAFFWGVAIFIFKAGDEEAKDRGKRIMIGGIIGLFVILAIWGILEFIGNALGVDVGEDVQRIPNVPER